MAMMNHFISKRILLAMSNLILNTVAEMITFLYPTSLLAEDCRRNGRHVNMNDQLFLNVYLCPFYVAKSASCSKAWT